MLVKDLRFNPHSLDFESRGDGVEAVVSGAECLAQNFSLHLRSLPAFQELFNADASSLRQIIHRLEAQLQRSQNLPIDLQRTTIVYDPQTKQLECAVYSLKGQRVQISQAV